MAEETVDAFALLIGQVAAHVGRQLLPDAFDLAQALGLIRRQQVIQGPDARHHVAKWWRKHGLAQFTREEPGFLGTAREHHDWGQVLPEQPIHLVAPIALAAFPGVRAAHARKIVFQLRAIEAAHLDDCDK